MDLQSRKLNLIEYLIQTTDEKVIQIIEEIIIKLKSKNQNEFKRFSKEELINRAKKANQDYRNGKYKTQDIAELESQNW